MRQTVKLLGTVVLILGAACGPLEPADVASEGQAIEADGKSPPAEGQSQNLLDKAENPLSVSRLVEGPGDDPEHAW